MYHCFFTWYTSLNSSLLLPKKYNQKVYQQHQTSTNRKQQNFNSCEFEVHLDEKWFNLTLVDQAVYLTEGEIAPHQHTQHKSHIPKVMFLCAVARHGLIMKVSASLIVRLAYGHLPSKRLQKETATTETKAH
jgi:hypothetical protein